MSTILENLNTLVQEVRAKKKKVMRAGIKTIKMTCPSGFKYDKQTNNCVRMSMTEVNNRNKAALKGARVRSRDTFGQSQSLKKRAITMKKGEQKGLYTKF